MGSEDKRSSRTKMIDESSAEDSTFKRGVKSITSAISRGLDRVGFTQEDQYKDKSKKDLTVKKAKGGVIRCKGDGIARKGKTKGKFC